jgi:CHAT domain-containing protein
VSLWKVADDTTPALMYSFYEFLNQGFDAAEALRSAKLASLRDARRAHPFHWAPFVLVGGLQWTVTSESIVAGKAPATRDPDVTVPY